MSWNYVANDEWKQTIDGWRFRLRMLPEGYELTPLGDAEFDKMYDSIQCVSDAEAEAEARAWVDRRPAPRPRRVSRTITDL